MKNELQFRMALRQAARIGLVTGKITGKEWLQIQSVLWNSKRKTEDGTKIDLIEEIAEGSLAQLQVEGHVPVGATVDAVDWSALINFIKDGLPTIMAFITQLLALFGK